MAISDWVDFKDLFSHISEIAVAAAILLFTAFSRRIKEWLERKTNDKFEKSINKLAVVRDELTALRVLYNADRVSLFQLHNGNYYFSGEGADKLSLTHFVLGPGVAPTENSSTKMQNIPVSHWPTAFSLMAAQGFYFEKASDIKDPVPAQAAAVNGVKCYVLGPVKDRRGMWRGVVALSFLDEIKKPDLKVAAEYGQRLGDILSV